MNLASQKQFAQTLVETGALRFGDFTTKAGRKSPYFVNFGQVCDAKSLQIIADSYAELLHSNFIGKCDAIFGPAYKGISLSIATSLALLQNHNINLPFSYNRKEIKAHGEGGNLIGWKPSKGSRFILVDDVISRGTSIVESIRIIQDAGAELVGVIVGLDRQEAGFGGRPASQEIAEKYGVPVLPILKLTTALDILEKVSLQSAPALDAATRKKIEEYVAATYL
jgi:orotate phosphoribosyltransferase